MPITRTSLDASTPEPLVLRRNEDKPRCPDTAVVPVRAGRECILVAEVVGKRRYRVTDEFPIHEVVGAKNRSAWTEMEGGGTEVVRVVVAPKVYVRLHDH